MNVHIECNADEQLVLKLDIAKKQITHHQGKSRIFSKLQKSREQLALVDEDPGSIKSTYQKKLRKIDEFEGITHYQDNSDNDVYELKGKLEDWILQICKIQKINLSNYNLPDEPNQLHRVVNQKLDKYSSLLDQLIKDKNPSIVKLRSWLHGKD